MQRSTHRPNRGLRGWLARLKRGGGGAALTVLATVALLAAAQQAPNRDPNRPFINPAANPVPDKNQQMEMQAQHPQNANYEAVNGERQKQIADEAAQLLQLATDLKKEVDKSDKDTLSIAVIRKAEMIEKLAKGVKEKMKQTGRAN